MGHVHEKDTNRTRRGHLNAKQEEEQIIWIQGAEREWNSLEGRVGGEERKKPGTNQGRDAVRLIVTSTNLFYSILQFSILFCHLYFAFSILCPILSCSSIPLLSYSLFFSVVYYIVPQWGTEPGVRKGKRSLLACHTRCKCSMETTR